MADIVNLRQARKAKAKQAKNAIAEANRIQFGRTKAEKSLTEARAKQAKQALDGHKIGDGQDES
jgi:hypothetical protein